MINQQKHQHLIDAALADPSLPSANRTKRYFPVPVFDAMPVPAVEAPMSPFLAENMVPLAPVFALPHESLSQSPRPTMARILDRAASSQLAELLNDQDQRHIRESRTNFILIAILILGMIGGSSAWFFSSRTSATAIASDIRSLSASSLVQGETNSRRDGNSNETTSLKLAPSTNWRR